MTRPERDTLPVLKLEPISQPRFVLVALSGTTRPGCFYEPLGLEVLKGRLARDLPQIKTDLMIPQLGWLDDEEIATSLANQSIDVLGLSVPQGAWNQAKIILHDLDKLPEQRQPRLILLGNTVPSWAPPEMIFTDRNFRELADKTVLVRHEAEEAVLALMQHLTQGTSWKNVPNLTFKTPDNQIRINPYSPPDLERSALPDRASTLTLSEYGAYLQAETSRDCTWRNCSFCLKPEGGSYRLVPREKVLADLQTLVDQGVRELGFADEDFLSRLPRLQKEKMELAKTVIKQKWPLKFAITTRADSLILAQKQGLLDLLFQAGLVKVFLGVEAGSDAYLEKLGKGITLEQVKQALSILKDHRLRKEIGFITFAQDLPFAWLMENVDFLTSHFHIVSSVLNEMRVYHGSQEYLRWQKLGRLGAFDLNTLAYSVEYDDPQVGQIASLCRGWEKQSSGVYDALKSLVRRELAPTDPQQDYLRTIQTWLDQFRLHDLIFLRAMVDLVKTKAKARIIRERARLLRSSRRILIEEISKEMGTLSQEDISGLLRKEVENFLLENGT